MLTDLPGVELVRGAADVARLREGRFGAGSLKLSAYHPMGTARMAAQPGRRGVRPLGRRVHGAPGVWVADASLFPSCLGVNPQITIMAFATRAARALAAELT